MSLNEINWQAVYEKIYQIPSDKGRHWYYKFQKGICYYCGKETSFEKWTVDHKTPRSRGGSSLNDNKVGACYSCNHIKGNLTAEEFLAVRHDGILRKQKQKSVAAA